MGPRNRYRVSTKCGQTRVALRGTPDPVRMASPEGFEPTTSRDLHGRSSVALWGLDLVMNADRERGYRQLVTIRVQSVEVGGEAEPHWVAVSIGLSLRELQVR